MKLGQVCDIKYGKDHKSLPDGSIPVYGSGGIMRYANQALWDKPSVLIPRKGTLSNLFYSEKPFWTVDTLFWTKIDESLVIPKYLYYSLLTKKLADLNVGTAVPSLTTDALNDIEIMLPSLEVQAAIVNCLNSFDTKLELNNRINDYLADCSRALFSHWFVDYGKWGGTKPLEWKESNLGEYVVVKRGGSPRPIQEFLSNEGLRWLKISDVTGVPSPYILSIKEHIKEAGLNKTVHLNSGALVLSNSATPGIPKILDLDTCIHDGWLYFPESDFSNEWLYLYFLYQREQLVSLANGSVFKNLKTDIVKNFKLTVPSHAALDEFQKIIDPLFKQMLICSRESAKLGSLRDTLLPKLMSGEIDVSQVDLTQLNNHLSND